MSDSSNDESKDMNKESEVSSSSSNRHQNRPTAEDAECDASCEEPKPRSLSPDTSDAASAEQAGPSQASVSASSVPPNPIPSVETQGEALTSTTDNGRGEQHVAESSHQEAGVSSGDTSTARSSQPAVSSALQDKDDAKSSSSEEYFEADASAFEPALEIPDVSGSRDSRNVQEAEASLVEQLSTTRHPWELDISSESNSQDAIAIISSGQLSTSRQAITESNSQEAEATLRHPQKSWEMLLSYESSSDEDVAESSNQQSNQPSVSGLQREAEQSSDQVSEAREISTTQQQSACASPSNCEGVEVDDGNSREQLTSQEVVTGSARDNEEGASSSQIQSNGGAVSGSINEEAGPSRSNQQESDEQVEEGTSSDQVLTSSGQPSTSQERNVSESRRISQEIESNQQLSSSQQPDISDSNEGEEAVDTDPMEDNVLTSSGQPTTSRGIDISEIHGESQEAEASVAAEQVSSESEDADAESTSQQQASFTVSGSDDLGNTVETPRVLVENSEAGQSSSTRRQVDVSGSNDTQEEDIGMSSTSTQSAQRPDSPSTRRVTERLAGVQEPGHSNQQLTSSDRSQAPEDESSPSSASALVSHGREVDPQPEVLAESSAATNQLVAPSVSSATVERTTESSDEEPGSASAELPETSAIQRPLEPPRMSVLAQQLTVSSASGRNTAPGMPRPSQHLGGASNRHSNVGPDSTTMDQSALDRGEEVSTTEEEQPGQVSTSQQRVVSTSWPQHTPSRVSSSADSSAAHITTSARLGGLLASRLSRDPLVSTSANAAPANRDVDFRDGGASSTTSGLRGLLSSGPRPLGINSNRSLPINNSLNFDPSPPLNLQPSNIPSQRSIPESVVAPHRVAGHSAVGSSLVSAPPTVPQPSSSSSQMAQNCSTNVQQNEVLNLSEPSQSGSSQRLSTAPGDKFPGDDSGKKPKKRKRSPTDDDDNSNPPPAPKNSQPGPSNDHSRNEFPSNSASLMEQLRKAGVIVTSVPAVPSLPSTTPNHQVAASHTSSEKVEGNIMNFKCLSVTNSSSAPLIHPSVSRISEQLDSNSSDEIQVLGMFDQSESPQQQQQSEVPSLVESAEESTTGLDDGDMMLVDQDTEDKTPGDEGIKRKRGGKRGPRKPVEINPDMLRPKRPRKAKEKESEEDTKEKPKRGRKKKIQPGTESEVKEEVVAATPPDVEEQEVEVEVEQPVVVEVLPEKPQKPVKTKKEKAPKTPKVVRELLRPQDEDTRMSASADDSQQSRPTPSVESTPRKTRTNINLVLPELDVVAESLVEYQWPLNDRLAESFMIQEQVTQYLGIKSFKRKYPDLKRRQVEPEEREFLQERGLVSESMCDLGLTAVQSSEVLDIMSADFHDKYEEYRRAVRDKQARELSGKQKAAAAAANSERGRQVDQKTRAMQSAAKWNASLNRDRREERRCCCDLQTLAVQFPKSRIRAMTKEVPKLGTYPVALIPGQFTDFYKRYTPAELRYLPLNTVLYGPLRPNEQEERGSEGSPSDSEDSSSSDESSSSSSSDGTQDTEETGSTAADPDPDIATNCITPGPPAGTKCKVCALPGNTPESMVTCAQCNNSGHLGCLGLSVDMLPHIRRYAWQCTDCKTCIQCKDPADEDKMLFCDMCDRGYHIYCVGLRKVPDGRWHCQECAVCGSCGSLDPGGVEALPNSPPPASPDKIAPQWQHEFKKGDKGARIYAQTLCVPCSRLWRRGSFCQLCYRCFRKPDMSTMLSCSVCDKWMHAECCSLAPGAELPKIAGNFVCEVCQEASQVRATNPRMMKLTARV